MTIDQDMQRVYEQSAAELADTALTTVSYRDQTLVKLAGDSWPCAWHVFGSCQPSIDSKFLSYATLEYAKGAADTRLRWPYGQVVEKKLTREGRKNLESVNNKLEAAGFAHLV